MACHTKHLERRNVGSASSPRPASRRASPPCWLLLAAALALPAAGRASGPQRVVIDTDVGLDDVVALGLALQAPELDIAAIVVTEGAASTRRGVDLVLRLLHYFNREEIPLYALDGPQSPTRQAPPFRDRLEQNLDQALPPLPRAAAAPRQRCRPCRLSPAAYQLPAGTATRSTRTVVLALGPLTSLAAALAAEPALAGQIARVVYRGSPCPAQSWNTRFDPGAVAAVQAAGIELVCLRPAPAARKSARWLTTALAPPRTSLAATLLHGVFATAGLREHYLRQLPQLTDELVLLFVVDRSLFGRRAGNAYLPRSRAAVSRALTALIQQGRQRRDRPR